MDQWANYFPSLLSPFGMFFYSIIVYILLIIHKAIKNQTVEKYVE